MSHQTWSNEWIAEKRNKWVKRQSECIHTQSSCTWIWKECIFLNYNACFFFLFLPFFLTVFTLMVTMLERERIILTVLYVIPSGPAYVHYDCSMVWKETSDGEKKKKPEILAWFQLNSMSNNVIWKLENLYFFRHHILQ